MLPNLAAQKLLYLVADVNVCHISSLGRVVEQAILGGVKAVQLRAKQISSREFLQIGQRLKVLTAKHAVPLIINDRVDIALALEADGIHLGQSDMPYRLARKILGYDKIIGLTINTLQQAEEAQNLDVDYLGVAPIFTTPTKADAGDPWNFNELKKLCQISKHRLIGIGGITAQNVREVITTGLHGIAVVSAICGSQDPRSSAAALCQAMG
jgi:thiamine-phosphate pyrophosphorylase